MKSICPVLPADLENDLPEVLEVNNQLTDNGTTPWVSPSSCCLLNPAQAQQRLR